MPISTANEQGPTRSPTVLETPIADSVNADAHCAIDASDAPEHTIPFFAIRSAIHAPGVRMRGFPKILQISGGDGVLESVVPTGEILRVVLQAGERIDAGRPGVDLLPDIVGEGVIIAFCLRLAPEQGT